MSPPAIGSFDAALERIAELESRLAAAEASRDEWLARVTMHDEAFNTNLQELQGAKAALVVATEMKEYLYILGNDHADALAGRFHAAMTILA